MGMGIRGMGALLGLALLGIGTPHIHVSGEFKPVSCGGSDNGPVRLSRRKRREQRKAAKLKGRR